VPNELENYMAMFKITAFFFGIFPPFGILENGEKDDSETGSVSVFR
jgi:hypothetical protein